MGKTRFFKGKFIGRTEQEIAQAVRREGFDPLLFHNTAGERYVPHEHPETKVLAFLEGSMELRVGDETLCCVAGDELMVPGNITHSAIAEPEGCRFYWSEFL